MVKRMRKLAALGTMAALAFGAQAAAADFSYNLIEGTYVASADIENVDGDGFGVSGSFELTPMLFAFGALNNLDFSGADLDELGLGLGVNWGLNDSVDVVGGFSYERVKLEGVSNSGFGMGVGLRGRIAERFELTGGVKYRDLGNGADGTELNFGGRYYFTENFAAGADFRRFDLGSVNGNFISISARYDFGSRM
jgi:hypothetical protein